MKELSQKHANSNETLDSMVSKNGKKEGPKFFFSFSDYTNILVSNLR